LEWVAYHLSNALAALPPIEPAPDEPPTDGVLGYERPTHAAGLVRVRRFRDGTLTVTLPVRSAELLHRYGGVAIGLLIATVVSAHVGGFLGGRAPLFFFFVLVPFVLWVIGYAVRKSGTAAVITVDSKLLCVNDPCSWRRLRQWPKHHVRDVRIRDYEVKGNKQSRVEITFEGSSPLKLMDERTETDRRRVVRALRGALGLKPLADAEMHVE
jgi:hypothetical protein